MVAFVRALPLLLGLVAFIEVVWLGYQYWRGPVRSVQFWSNSTIHLAHQNEISHVVRDFLANIKDLHPSKGAGNVPPLTKFNKNMNDDMHVFQVEAGYPAGDEITIEMLKDYLIVDKSWKDTLKGQHKAVVSKIPPVPRGALNGRGIVMTGGGRLFGNALIAIRFVLEYHPNLPIELWMAHNEYEPLYCEEVFPALNVSCKVMENVFGEDNLEGFDYMGYPLKSLALLGSAFEEIYFMDIDSFALQSINDLFKSEAYNTTGYISWPDYWLRITTPEFYEIAGVLDINAVDKSKQLIDLPQTVRERLSSETGQVVIDKRRHWDTMALAAYYNLNGREYYYPLLSQQKDVPGFGDKETFVAAAAVLGHPAYQVKESVYTFAYPQKNGELHGSGMAQRDPFSDYQLHMQKKKVPVGAYVLHANNMKLDPFFTFSDREEDNWNMPNLKAWRRRNLGNADHVTELLGFDVELRVLQVMQNVICDWLVSYSPKNLHGQDMPRTCKVAKAHVDWLEQNPTPY